jgi:multidrug resistance efflux pump
MTDQSNDRFVAASNPQSAPREADKNLGGRGTGGHRHPVILRVSALGVAAILSALMVTAVLPPIVADQSDRAVVDAPVALLTAPIGGEIDQIAAVAGHDVRAGDRLAQISNPRLDRSTLISLEERSADAREKLAAARANRQSDTTYVASLDAEIAGQIAQLKAQLQAQIEELRARVAQSMAMSGEKKALVDRQSNMVARDAASKEMLAPTEKQYSAALHNTDAENAKLNQKLAQLQALNDGVYVGEDLVAINTLAQKRRDIDLDAKRMEIEEKQQSAVLNDLQHLIDMERERLATLAAADVVSGGQGKVLTVGAEIGRHVSAGDTVAAVVDCDQRFVVAIFSYREGESMKPGTRVRIDGASFHSGVVSAVLPKTSDKVDERFAVPFPQTERRELYVMIAPDVADEHGVAAAAASVSTPACTVGQWVTVTRDNGIVPSMSVTWRRVGNLMASWWGHDQDPNANSAATRAADLRRAATARLESAFRSFAAQQPGTPNQGWLARAHALVSR